MSDGPTSRTLMVEFICIHVESSNKLESSFKFKYIYFLRLLISEWQCSAPMYRHCNWKVRQMWGEKKGLMLRVVHPEQLFLSVQ